MPSLLEGEDNEKGLEYVGVKEAVFPFNRFRGVDNLLGPEMKSTGEVMAIDVSFGVAFAQAQLSAGNRMNDEIIFDVKKKEMG